MAHDGDCRSVAMAFGEILFVKSLGCMVGATAFVPCGKVGITLATVVCLGAPSSMSNAAFGLVTVLLLTGINAIGLVY